MFLATTMVFGLTACGVKKPTGETGNKTEEKQEQTQEQTKDNDENAGEGYELALITDVGTIDDKSFNQGSWEGLVKYADEHNITHKYYKPSEKSDEACLNAIDLAVKAGAKVVVTPGFLFNLPVFKAQTKYPDTHFIMIDAAPTNEKDETVIADNTTSIFYAEEQAGFLAGYAAVEEGYRQLGFMGGIAVPAVERFGYGFVQGADAAAKDMNVPAGEINIKYTYLGNFEASPENNAKAAAWYNEGVECIFVAAGGAGNSVMKAAETAGKKVIGVDVDQSSESETVITSAMKNLGDSVYGALEDFYAGKFEGGKAQTLDAAVNGIKLPMETSKFETFSQEKYDDLYAKLVDGTIKVQNDEDVQNVKEIEKELVNVELIK